MSLNNEDNQNICVYCSLFPCLSLCIAFSLWAESDWDQSVRGGQSHVSQSGDWVKVISWCKASWHQAVQWWRRIPGTSGPRGFHFMRRWRPETWTGPGPCSRARSGRTFLDLEKLKVDRKKDPDCVQFLFASAQLSKIMTICHDLIKKMSNNW